jgi:DNA-binding NarL/FixJ family response regulator
MSHIPKILESHQRLFYSYLLYHGGIEPKTRIRRSNFLLFEERESISRGIASGLSMRNIARHLGRHPFTVTREISRNGGLKRYRACLAENPPQKE